MHPTSPEPPETGSGTAPFELPNHPGLRLLANHLDALRAAKRPQRPALWDSFVTAETLPDLAAAYNEHQETCRQLSLIIGNLPGCSARATQLIKTMSKASWEEAQNLQADTAVRLSDSFTSIPTDLLDAQQQREIYVPMGYVVDESGIWRSSQDGGPGTRVSASPVIISGRTVGRTGDAEGRQIMWFSPDGWQSKSVDRRTLFDSRKMMELINWGFPVNSTNARGMVTYLAAFEDRNAASLPITFTSSHLGWQGDADTIAGFMLPSGYIHCTEADGADFVLSAPPALSAVSEGWMPKGSWSQWLGIAAEAMEFPTMALAVYASCAPPLLEILGCNSFIVDIHGETSSGKTTALRLAASCWGRPSDTSPTALYTWDATKVWIERATGYLHSLPLILDETKRNSADMISEVIYEFANGQGRGRGNISGIDHTSSWRSVLISSGEGPLTAGNKNAGTRARVLSLGGRPLGSSGGAIAEELTRTLMGHHGHLGPRLIKYLTHLQPHWSALRRSFSEHRDRYIAAAGGPVSRRHGTNLAVLALTADLVHQLGLPKPKGVQPMDMMLEAMSAAEWSADVPLGALVDVVSWAAANSHRFFGRHDPERPTTFFGAWAAQENWGILWVEATELEARLTRLGYTYAEIVDRWRERGWLVNNGRRYAVDLAGGARAFCLGLSREAVDEAAEDIRHSS